MKTKLIALAITGLALFSLPAWADEAPTVASSTTEVAARGAHVHDGFYLRLGTGFGSYSETLRRSGEDNDTLITGITSAGEWTLGGTIRPGLIIGGGVFSATTLASDRVVRGSTPPGDIVDARGDFAIVGPFFDYYFDPRKGLHVEGALGIANVRGLSIESGSFDKDHIAVGFGMVAGFGYEWWVSNEWSIGILGRLSAAVAASKDDNDNRWWHLVGASPSVLFTATYN